MRVARDAAKAQKLNNGGGSAVTVAVQPPVKDVCQGILAQHIGAASPYYQVM